MFWWFPNSYLYYRPLLSSRQEYLTENLTLEFNIPEATETKSFQNWTLSPTAFPTSAQFCFSFCASWHCAWDWQLFNCTLHSETQRILIVFLPKYILNLFISFFKSNTILEATITFSVDYDNFLNGLILVLFQSVFISWSNFFFLLFKLR